MPKERKFSFIRDLLLPLILLSFVIFTGYLFFNFLVEYDVIKIAKNNIENKKEEKKENIESKKDKSESLNEKDKNLNFLERLFLLFKKDNFNKDKTEILLKDNNKISSSDLKDENIIIESKNNSAENKIETTINNNQVEEKNISTVDKTKAQESVVENKKLEEQKNIEIKYIEKEYFIYLVDVDESGNIIFRKIKVKIKFIDSPIFELIKTLISYKSSQYKNLIPEGTQIKSAWIKNGICYVDFNKNFLNNKLGYKGVEAQVYQVVNTIMQFENVKGVIIYIEGKVRKYFSEEGFIMDVVFTTKEKL
ncbi:MAG: GerMN domain-containing protein [Spirochaetes bacterium]|nr:GerMN domain-containing protein [Spirochaetota bacterium]